MIATANDASEGAATDNIQLLPMDTGAQTWRSWRSLRRSGPLKTRPVVALRMVRAGDAEAMWRTEKTHASHHM